MSVAAPDRTQSFEYTNTVRRPVRRNAHHTQLPLIPSRRIISVKRFAELVEVVAATIETPMSHHGMEPADLKYSRESPDFVRMAATAGISSRTAKNSAIAM